MPARLLGAGLVVGVMSLLAAPPAASQSPGQPVTGLVSHVFLNGVTLVWDVAWGNPEEEEDPAPFYTVIASLSRGGPPIAVVLVPGVDANGNPTPFYMAAGVPNGVYFVRVLVGNTPAGPATTADWIVVDVGGASCTSTPAAPTNLRRIITATAQVQVAWDFTSAPCPPDAFVLEVGSSSGASNLGVFFASTNGYVGDGPPGVYYVRVRARNRFGLSPPSAELVVTIAGCNSPGAPVGFSAVVMGSTVQFSWSPPVTGDLSRLLGYLISAGFLPGQQSVANLRLGNVTSYTATGVPAGTYYVRVHALTSCPGSGVGAPSSEIQVVVP